MEISLKEKRILLESARTSIQSIFGEFPLPKNLYPQYSLFNTKSGAFVTLTIYGKLRGCIGYIISEKPLFQTVCDAAVQAASQDPRFSPLTIAEINTIEIEISILSLSFPLSSYEDIIVGKHGLILEEAGRRALLLPQVPVEHNLDRTQFLSALCQKAGLSSEYWKEKEIKLSAFTAEVFSESSLED